ncbi:MAG: dihydroxyacetone kinase subunit L [Erysipelotrichaceae bacterium]|nr:dihydroxyacetone kinase subunit L [Erysipelotrichaceae bacterium]
MKDYIYDNNNSWIVLDIIEQIHLNSSYLSEIDGATGDGDHGVNMDKGFMLAKEKIPLDSNFTEALKILGRTLVMDIGGSMGPIYGTFFSKLSRTLKSKEEIDKYLFLDALKNANQGLLDLAGAKVGDKTLIDTLYPAILSYENAINNNLTFYQCLYEMKQGAKSGMESTKDMVAKIGRASRLGERSKGYLDAGATSCFIILDTMANSIQKELAK